MRARARAAARRAGRGRVRLSSEPTEPRIGAPRQLLALSFIVAVGLVLRLESIERRGISHPEVYVPGIELPAEISEPPPRIGFVETLAWHIHSEVHPPAYFYAMWPWTRSFGTSLRSLRMPSLLLGVATIALLYFVVAREFGGRAGLIAAALLCANGHHILWSDMARMYALACFLALLSTGLWMDALRRSELSTRRLSIYAVVTWLGLATQLYCWLLLAAQVGFAVWRGVSTARLQRILRFQAGTAIVAVPLITHAVYHNRGQSYGGVSLGFVQDFLNFGFLFTPDLWSAQLRDAPAWLEWTITVVALAAIAAFLRDSANAFRPASSDEADPSVWKLWPLVVGVSCAILALAASANESAAAMAATAALAPLVLVGAALCARLPAPGSRTREPRFPGASSPLFWAAFVPFGLLLLLSLFRPMLLSRALLLLVPMLLGVLAVGLSRLRAPRWALVVLGLFLVLAHVESFRYFRDVVNPNDYRGLAEQLEAELEPGDLIFVAPRSWSTTPVFYHLRGKHHRIVADDHAEALHDSPRSRVWVLLFSDQQISVEMRAALQKHGLKGARSALRSRAVLYVPVSDGAQLLRSGALSPSAA